MHLDLTELLHEQLTTVFASGWLGTSTLCGDSTKSINPTFCTIGLLDKSEAAISVCSSLLHDRHPSLSPSVSVWLPASDILFEAKAIGFVFNSPYSTFGPAILPQPSVRIQNGPVSYSHCLLPQTDHLHHWWKSSVVMPSSNNHLLYVNSFIFFFVTRYDLDFKIVNQCFHHIGWNSHSQQI